MNLTLAFTFASIALCAAALLAYDVVAAMRHDPGMPTITHELQRVSARFIAIPFLAGLGLGLVCGHLFGQF